MGIPDMLEIGEREYDVVSWSKKESARLPLTAIIKLAKELDANLGEEEGKYIEEHAQDIPAGLHGMIIFLISEWTSPDGMVATFNRSRISGWMLKWEDPKQVAGTIVRLLRRRATLSPTV